MLAFTSIFLAPVSSFSMALCSKLLKSLSRKHLDALAVSTHRAASRFSAIKAIRVYHAEAREIKYFSNMIDDSTKISLRMAVAESVLAGSSFFNSHGLTRERLC